MWTVYIEIGFLSSSGHSAKYGSYSVMHLESNKITDIQLVQVSVKYMWIEILPATDAMGDMVVKWPAKITAQGTNTRLSEEL